MKLTNGFPWMVAALVVLSGCQSEEKTAGFFPKATPEQVQRFCDIQAANGARQDAMLYDRHFEGEHLNQLGRQKLLLMLKECDACEPITVHLVNIGAGDVLERRKAAVALYLKTADGANPKALHPAAGSMARIVKTESGSMTVEAVPADATMMGGTSMTK